MARERNFSEWVFMMREFISLLRDQSFLDNAVQTIVNAEDMAESKREELRQANKRIEQSYAEAEQLKKDKQDLADKIAAHNSAVSSHNSNVNNFEATKIKVAQDKEFTLEKQSELEEKRVKYEAWEKRLNKTENEQESERQRLKALGDDLNARDADITEQENQFQSILRNKKRK